MQRTAKKRVMTSYANLSDELKVTLKEKYPMGFADVMSRVDKPNGDFFYGVMLETEDTSYFVKIDVKVDDKGEEDLDKMLFADEPEEISLKGAEDIADDSSDDE